GLLAAARRRWVLQRSLASVTPGHGRNGRNRRWKRGGQRADARGAPPRHSSHDKAGAKAGPTWRIRGWSRRGRPHRAADPRPTRPRRAAAPTGRWLVLPDAVPQLTATRP